MRQLKPLNFLMLLVFILCSYAIVCERSTIVEEYTLGEWLINYSAGFVRRGLSGTVILYISEIFNIKPEFLINTSLVLLFFANSLLIAAILVKLTAQQTFWLLFSPALALMIPTEIMARKENLFFLVLFLHGALVLYKQERGLRVFQQVILPLSGILISLTHEIFLLFLPYHWLLIKFSNPSKRQIKLTTLLNLAPLLIFALALLFPGTYETQTVMCEWLKDFAIPCKGGIEAIGMPAHYSAAHSLEIIGDAYSLRAYVLIFGITNLVTLILFRNSLSVLTEKNCMSPFLIINSGIFATVAMGWDFGRWIVLFSIHNFIFLAAIQPSVGKSSTNPRRNIIQEASGIFCLLLICLSLNTRYRALYHPVDAPISASKLPTFLQSGGNLFVNRTKLNSFNFGKKIKQKIDPNEVILASDPRLYFVHWTEPIEDGRWINQTNGSMVFSFEHQPSTFKGEIILGCSSPIKQLVEIKLNNEIIYSKEIDPSLTSLKLTFPPEILKAKVNQFGLDFYFPNFEQDKKNSPSHSTFWVKSFEVQ